MVYIDNDENVTSCKKHLPSLKVKGKTISCLGSKWPSPYPIIFMTKTAAKPCPFAWAAPSYTHIRAGVPSFRAQEKGIISPEKLPLSFRGSIIMAENCISLTNAYLEKVF